MKAPLGPRIIACVIDYVLFFALFMSYFYVFGTPSSSGGYKVSGSMAMPIPFLWILWFVLPEWHFCASPGKKFMRLKVVSTSGRLPSFGAVLLRRLCDPIDFWFSSGVVALIAQGCTKSGQRLGDLLARTVVVNESQRS